MKLVKPTTVTDNSRPSPAGPHHESRPLPKGGFPLLNWARFLLAMYIVLFHMRNNYPVIDHSWIDAAFGLGNMATSVFFVLSGFLLTYAYVVQKNGRPLDRHAFLLARFSTLYPLHLAGLLMTLVPMGVTIAQQGGITVPTEVSGSATRMLGHGEFGLALLSNVLLLNAWNPFYLSFNYPSWSLSALACYYFVFLGVASRVYRMKSPLLGLVALGIAFAAPGIVAHVLDRTDVFTDGVLHRNPIVRLPLFLAGMVLCVLFARTRTVGSPWQTALAVSTVVATVAIGVALQYQENHSHMIRNGLYFPASLAFIWLCVSFKPSQNATFRHWGERLGAASLPVFLLHSPIYLLFIRCEKVVRAALEHSDAGLGAILAAGRNIEPSLPFLAIYLVGLVFLCIVVQERFVAPLQVAIRNRLARKRPEVQEAPRRTGTA